MFKNTGRLKRGCQRVRGNGDAVSSYDLGILNGCFSFFLYNQNNGV
jgi:hypothetical protein